MDIGCYLITEGTFEKALISEDMLTELAKSLRNNGPETVHFADKSILVEGIYIPAKGTTTSFIIIPEE